MPSRILRKIMACLIATVLAVGMPLSEAYAETTEGGFTYERVDGGVSITGYQGTAADIVIPGVVDGKTVVGISSGAFAENQTIETVEIADSVTCIENFAFDRCKSLRTVIFPDALKSIGACAFALTDIESAILPATLEVIDESAFAQTSLKGTVKIPASVAEIGARAFDRCEELQAIVVDPANIHYYSDEKGVLYSYDDQSLVSYPAGRQDTEYAVDAGTKNICADAFEASALIEITISEGVEYIGNNAFYNCIELKTINLPSTLKRVEEGAFGPNLHRLVDINLASGNETFSVDSAGVLYNDSEKSLVICPCDNPVLPSSYTVREGTKLICPSAFQNCNKYIREVNLPDSVTRISEGAFATGANIVRVPGSVVEFGQQCFVGVPTVYVSTQAQYDLLKDNAYYLASTGGSIDTEIILNEKGIVGAFEAEIGFKATVGGKNAYTTVEWDDGWFDLPSTDYVTHSWSSTIFNDELHELATTAAVLSGSAYERGLARNALETLGFEIGSDGSYYPSKNDYNNESKGGINQVAYTFGIRETAQGYPVIAVVIRGTPNNVEWLSNLNISDSAEEDIGAHEGFTHAAYEVFQALTQYVEKHDEKYDISNARVLITGHSRGAAVANVLGAMLTNGNGTLASNLSEERIYDFTFACPTTVKQPDSGCDNIYNIVNPEDIVTEIPLSRWGYGRHGITLCLPSKSNTSSTDYQTKYNRMNALFSDPAYAGVDYQPYKQAVISRQIATNAIYDLASSVDDVYGKYYKSILYDPNLGGPAYRTKDLLNAIGAAIWGKDGLDNFAGALAGASALLQVPAFDAAAVKIASAGILNGLDSALPCVVHGHSQETYVSWMQSGSAKDVFADTYWGLRVACPVDVQVNDVDNQRVVASIVNDVVDEDIENGLPAAVVDGVKMIDIPADRNYQIVITARDEGTMDFTVEGLNGYDDIPIAVKSYQGVPLEPEGVYISAGIPGPVDEIEDIRLVAQGDIYPMPEVDCANKVEGNPSYVDVNVLAEGGGDAWGGGRAMTGSQVTVHASAASGSSFDGWYIGGVKVSVEEEYTLRADDSMEIIARFRDQQEPSEPGVDPIPGGGNEEDEPSADPEEPSGPSAGALYDVIVEEGNGRGSVETSVDKAKAGEAVTVTAHPLFGYLVGTLTVLDAEGEVYHTDQSGEGGSWVFTMPDGDVTVIVSFAIPAWENPYSDVTEESWYWNAVRRATLAGLMHGYDDGTFGPDDGLLREQAATVMWNLMGEGNVSLPAAEHDDVGQGEWYSPYVNWAVDEGVMEGYDGGEFGVGDALTREQFAAVIAKAVGADVGAADRSVLEVFPDAGGVSGWARETMAWAVENGLVSGVETEDGTRELQATRTLARAEMATMMMNAVDKGVLALS